MSEAVKPYLYVSFNTRSLLNDQDKTIRKWILTALDDRRQAFRRCFGGMLLSVPSVWEAPRVLAVGSPVRDVIDALARHSVSCILLRKLYPMTPEWLPDGFGKTWTPETLPYNVAYWKETLHAHQLEAATLGCGFGVYGEPHGPWLKPYKGAGIDIEPFKIIGEELADWGIKPQWYYGTGSMRSDDYGYAQAWAVPNADVFHHGTYYRWKKDGSFRDKANFTEGMPTNRLNPGFFVGPREGMTLGQQLLWTPETFVAWLREGDLRTYSWGRWKQEHPNAKLPWVYVDPANWIEVASALLKGLSDE